MSSVWSLANWTDRLFEGEEEDKVGRDLAAAAAAAERDVEAGTDGDVMDMPMLLVALPCLEDETALDRDEKDAFMAAGADATDALEEDVVVCRERAEDREEEEVVDLRRRDLRLLLLLLFRLGRLLLLCLLPPFLRSSTGTVLVVSCKSSSSSFVIMSLLSLGTTNMGL